MDKKLKIGVLTIHCNYNYGSLLQCYALQSYLESIGCEVQIINYRPDYLATKLPKLFLSVFQPKRFVKRLIKYSYLKKNYYLFKKSEEKLHLSKEVVTKKELEEICQDFDFLFLGSDQIWARRFTKGDRIWFGMFNAGNARKIAYAASAGDLSLSQEDIASLPVLMGNFFQISVREKVLSEFLLKRIGVSFPYVLDPTLMVSDTLWSKWYHPIRKDRYIVIRQARVDSNVKRIARGLSKQLKCKIVSVDSTNWSLWGVAEQHAYSPFEFISLVRNALCVVTTSFHGMAFSIICNTPFYVVRLNDGQDARADNLLKQIGLSNRMVEKNSVVYFESIDFTKANVILNQLKKESYSFINKALY